MTNSGQNRLLGFEQVMKVAIQLQGEIAKKPSAPQVEEKLKEIYRGHKNLDTPSTRQIQRYLARIQWPPLDDDKPWSLIASDELGVPNGHESLLLSMLAYCEKNGLEFSGRQAKWVAKLGFIFNEKRGFPEKSFSNEEYHSLLVVATLYAGAERLADARDDYDSRHLDLILEFPASVIGQLDLVRAARKGSIRSIDVTYYDEAIKIIDPHVLQLENEFHDSQRQTDQDVLDIQTKIYELLKERGKFIHDVYEIWVGAFHDSHNYMGFSDLEKSKARLRLAEEIAENFNEITFINKGTFVISDDLQRHVGWGRKNLLADVRELSKGVDISEEDNG